MKVSGFTLVRNGVQFDYPFLESLRSLLPLVDELVINVGIGDDDTLTRIQRFAAEEGEGKVRWFESEWPLNDPEKRRGGLILSEQTNLALEKCTGDWCIYLQADEVFHQRDHALIREAMEQFHAAPRIEGLLFDYVHLYGSFDVYQHSRSAYRREVRVIKRASGARSVGDAQSFRKPDGSKLHVAHSGARVFHYGWVRTPEAMKQKTVFMDQLYHGKADSDEVPHSGDNYRYKKFWGLKRFAGEHPGFMTERIRSKGWHWDLNSSPFVWIWKDLTKIALDLFEKATGYRLFEYRSYRLVERSRRGFHSHPASRCSDPSRPKASILLATYEMPRHLSLVLANLERQSTGDFEVIVCDDGSGPGTRRVIDHFRSRAGIRVIHIWQENKGFRKSLLLNKGIRESRGEILIFLDGDCVPNPRFVEDHVRQTEDGYYLCGRRVDTGERISATLWPTDARRGFFDGPNWRMIRSILAKDSKHFQRTYRVACPWVRKLLKMTRIDDLLGSNYSVQRKDMLAINGYDEDYEGYGREDTDIELRLQHLGLRIKSVKGLAVQYHIWHPRRAFTPRNDDLLARVRDEKRVRCRRGLEQLTHV